MYEILYRPADEKMPDEDAGYRIEFVCFSDVDARGSRVPEPDVRHIFDLEGREVTTDPAFAAWWERNKEAIWEQCAASVLDD